MKSDDEDISDEAASELVALVRPHLKRVYEDGFKPHLIVFPDQTTGNKNCRICRQEARLMKLTFFGGAVGKAYPFCVALACLDCEGSQEKREEFLERIKARYRVVTNQPNQG